MVPVAKSFSFVKYELDTKASELRFEYSIKLEKEERSFVEILKYPNIKPEQWRAIPANMLARMCETLHLALGMSYWKLYCPKVIEHSYRHTQAQANFWNTLYTKGFGEFFIRNQIDFRGLVNFPVTTTEPFHGGVESFPRATRCLVPFGGGKDSIVTGEMLKKAGFDGLLYTLGTSGIQEQGIEIMNLPSYRVERQIDPSVFELNKSGQVYNGHIPISSIYLFTGLLAALLQDSKWLVFSNEKSANIGNVDYLGMEVNHQWSKSIEFERLASDYIASAITKDVTFFSLLRPFYEIEVVRRFVQHPQYFKTFSSCNRNFKLTDPSTTGRNHWCGECPKCAFVYALLRAFLSKDQVVSFFGKELYEDKSLETLYRQLLGLVDFKPFECVGTPTETAYAFYLASKLDPSDQSFMMKLAKEEVLSKKSETEWQTIGRELLATYETELIPSEFLSLL